MNFFLSSLEMLKHEIQQNFNHLRGVRRAPCATDVTGVKSRASFKCAVSRAPCAVCDRCLGGLMRKYAHIVRNEDPYII